jgi:hypothetical protein
MLVVLQLVGAPLAPMNVITLVPWDEPKPVPVKVTKDPIGPDVGNRLVILGAATTVKPLALLFTPLANITTSPVVAPGGTVTAMLVAVQDVTLALVPLNLTVPVPWGEPKLFPVTFTAAPTVPVVIDRLVILGVATTVKLFPLLALPDTVTTTFPVVAPMWTVVTMLVVIHAVAMAVIPLNLMVLVPWAEPKLVPVIVTVAPTAPVVIDKPAMPGATVKLFPLLFTPLANTTTFPLVAPGGTVTAMLVAVQVVTLAVVPLKLTVPPPWGEPKLTPVTVTAAPTAPVVIDRLLTLGPATTVKFFPLLAVPETVTTTFPVVAPVRTVVTMVVAVHVVAIAVVLLNLTVLVPWGDPKFVPVTVTDVPTAPVVIDKLVMVGATAAWTFPDENSKRKNARTRLDFQAPRRICVSSEASQ